MGDRLKNKVALITGAGRGIGQQIAYSMASEGASIVVNDLPDGSVTSELTDICAGNAEKTATEIRSAGGQAISYCCDVSDFESTRAMIDETINAFGALHILVNNAAILALGDPWEFSEQEWDEVIGVSLKGTFNCIRHATGVMKNQKWGRIINCSSISALGTASGTVYGAAKAGVLGLTNSVAWDMRAYNVTCNAIFPQARQLLPEREAQAQKIFKSRLDRGQIDSQKEYDRIRKRPSPAAIAPFVSYLATDLSEGITGELFFVRGGKIAVYPKLMPRKEIIKSSEESESFWTLEELIDCVPELLSV